MTTGWGFALWALSFLGATGFLIRRGCAPAAAPLVAASLQTLAVWLGGLLGVMQGAAWAVWIVGAALLLWLALRRDRSLLRWELAALALVCALLWLRYRGAELLQYDDFSHWGLIAKYMLLNDRLPDAGAAVIAFQSYPPASACWLYAVLKPFGADEGMMLAAQAWLIAMGALPLYALARDGSRALCAALTALVALAMLSLLQGASSLMVDNLLAAIAVGCAAVALGDGGPRGRLWLAPPLALLCLVKDSGLFFLAILWLLLMVQKYAGGARREWKHLLAPVGLPVLCRAAWYAHIRTAFPAAERTRHAMSVVNFRQMGADKSYADLLGVGAKLASALLKPDNPVLWLFAVTLCCCAVVVAARRARGGTSARNEARLLVGAALSYPLYALSLWGMYAFTLPLESANKLVALARYNSTFALFWYGALAAYLALTVPRLTPARAGGRRAACALCALALAVPYALPMWRAGLPRLVCENYSVPLRTELAALARQRPLADGEPCAVFLGDAGESAAFAAYIARYEWMRDDVALLTPETVGSASLPGVVYVVGDDAALVRAAESAAWPVELVRLPD